MAPWLKGLTAGVLIGVAGFLLINRLGGDSRGTPEQLAAALGCSAGVNPSSAAAAHHANDGPYGYSWFAATHAEQVLYINGCDPVGPGTHYLQFSPYTQMSHVLATLRYFKAVCVVDHAIFDGKLLNDRAHLKELCAEVGGKLKVL